MYAVIRIRGGGNTKRDVEDGLKMLKLNKKHSCILVPETKQYEGMIKKLKNWVTWGEISEEMLGKLLHKRGEIGKKEAKEIIKGERKLKKSFKLSPPSKGFKGSIKQHYPKGALGNRGEKINELLKRMI